MNMLELQPDQTTPPADGELFVRPFGRDGGPLRDPLSIFVNRALAEKAIQTLRVPDYIAPGYLPVGSNLVVDRARQVLANLAGGLDSPTAKWIVNKVSFGTFDTAPRFTDTTLSPQVDPGHGILGGENEIEISTGVRKKLIESVDWPQPYVTRWEIVLTPEEALGYLIREMGLWTDGGNEDPQLVARKIFPAVNKTGDFGLAWLWLWRF